MSTPNPLNSALFDPSSAQLGEDQPQSKGGGLLSSDTATKEKVEVLRVVRAASLSSMLEFYDFSLIGALADVIGDQFFPSSNKSLRLIEAFSVFGSAFIFRPLGGALVGKRIHRLEICAQIYLSRLIIFVQNLFIVSS